MPTELVLKEMQPLPELEEAGRKQRKNADLSLFLPSDLLLELPIGFDQWEFRGQSNLNGATCKEARLCRHREGQRMDLGSESNSHVCG